MSRRTDVSTAVVILEPHEGIDLRRYSEEGVSLL